MFEKEGAGGGGDDAFLALNSVVPLPFFFLVFYHLCSPHQIPSCSPHSSVKIKGSGGRGVSKGEVSFSCPSIPEVGGGV